VRWLLLTGLWLCYFAFGVTAASIAPLVVPIQTELGLSHAGLGSIMGAWQFVYIGAAIPAGVLLDRLGSRHALVLGMACIALSAFGRAGAENYWQLLTAVMIFGIGGPIISSGAPKVVTELFEGRQRGLAMGIYMTGPTLGGILALTLTHPVLLPVFDGNWRCVMALWGAVAAGAAVTWYAIASRFGFRIPGFSADGSRSAGEASAGGGEGAIAADGTQGRSSLLAIRALLAIPGVPLVLAMSVGVFLFNHGLNNWLPELLRQGGMSQAEAGYWAALPMLIGILGSLTIPALATPARRFPILAGLCLAAAISSLLLTVAGPTATTTALVVQGLVRSSMMTVLILTLMELPGMKPGQAGTASGLFFSAAEVGGVLGPLGLGVLYDLTQGFSVGLCTLAGIAIAMLLGTARLARLGVKRTESRAPSVSDP
jgi:cyanate permease